MRRAAFGFIFATLLLDVLALGVIIPVLPALVKGFMGGDTERGSRMYGLFGTVWALMQFGFAPLLGALSDRFGRRPVILLSCLGLGLDYFLMAWAPTLGWLFAGRVISGITAASFATAYAYVADVTPPEKRAGTFGVMGAAWGVGFVLGPALGGFLGGISPRLPFWVAGALSLANFAYGLLVLPESLAPENRGRFSWARANPVGSLRLLLRHAELWGLGAVNFLYQLAHQVLPSVFVLYAGHRFGWSTGRVGALLAAVGICNIVVQAGLVRRFVGWAGERKSLLTGLFFGSAGFAIYGLAPTETLFWAAVPVFALIGFYGPAMNAIMTRRVAPSEQGQLQGANGSVAGIAGVVGPGLFTEVFARFIAPGRSPELVGAPFVLASLLMLVAIALAAAVTRTSAGAGSASPSGPAPVSASPASGASGPSTP
jgi:DHA1 family tetracycline resistance protein-like MFS transporter